MGNQASAPTPSSQGKARLQRVCDEAGKLFAIELEEERHREGSFRSTTHRAQAERNTNSKKHQPNIHQTVTLQSVLAAASRGIDLEHNPGEDSDSTRDTCDSPLFLPRPPRRQRGGANLNHPSEMKIQPDSLLSHLFHSGSHHRARRSHSDTTKTKTRSTSNKTKQEDMIVTNNSEMVHQPPQGPTFPELNDSTGGGSSQHHRQHRRTPVVKIPRRKQHMQIRAEEEEEEHLKRLYDSRTWNMYHRITEARAAACNGTSSSSPHHIENSNNMIAGGPPYPMFVGGGSGGGIARPADPTLQHQLGYTEHYHEPEDDEHELMFGDLEE